MLARYSGWPNDYAQERYERLVHNRHELPASWQG